MEPEINPLTGGIPFSKDTTKVTEEQTVKETKYNFVSDINKQFNPVPSKLSIEERFNLIKSIGTEVVMENQLMERLKEPRLLRAYDGFEPSGRMHIAQGILRAINVNKLVDAGCVFVFWVADWFAMLNHKLDGDLEKIRLVGRYFIEVWRAAGMKMSNVQFLWASDQINARSQDYWMMVMDIARKNTINRIKRCATIMGRDEGDDLSTAQLLYPCMQCTDIFFLDIDICQLGIDQRKVNMLAREYKTEGKKPIIVSHDMILGLLEGQPKMAKSDPDSAIFVEDNEEDVKRKIKQAYCPPKIVKDNPVLNYCKAIIFEAQKEFIVERPEKWGGNLVYKNYADLEKDFVEGQLHPGDLKPSVAKALNSLIDPIRKHFQTNEEAKMILETIKTFTKAPKQQAEKKDKKEGKEPNKEKQQKQPKQPKEPKESKEGEEPKESKKQQKQKNKKQKQGNTEEKKEKEQKEEKKQEPNPAEESKPVEQPAIQPLTQQTEQPPTQTAQQTKPTE